MPVYVIAIQNAVPYSIMGVATSTNTFFRSIGGAVGLAIAGSVMNNRLADELTGGLPPEISASEALNSALTEVFFIAFCAIVVAFIINLFLKEIPLRKDK
jgi:hypothetical protein